MTPAQIAQDIARENDLSRTHNETTLYLLVEGKIGKPTHDPIVAPERSNYTLWNETVAELLKLWRKARGTA